MRFASPLSVEFMVDINGWPLLNRDGVQLWQVVTNFVYESDVAGGSITVPAGFVTDFASVPRLPIIYASLGDLFQRSAVVHDYLYSTGAVPRKMADDVLLEAMTLDGIPWIKRKLVYAGVRVGGGSHYGGK